MCFPYGFLFTLRLFLLLYFSSSPATALLEDAAAPLAGDATASNKHHNHHHHPHAKPMDLVDPQTSTQEQFAVSEEDLVSCSCSRIYTIPYLQGIYAAALITIQIYYGKLC